MTMVNIRIDDKLKEQLKEYSVNVSDVVRSALKRELEERRKKKMMEHVKKASLGAKNVKIADVVSDLRELRNRR